MITTTLAVVVNGSAYESFAEDLFSSAEQFFRPTKKVSFLMLQGRPGWPAATMYRHHVLADHMPNTSYVFLCDSDMLFESLVGPEICPEYGIAATLHPGYVTTHRDLLPYEKNPDSAAHVLPHQRAYYYAGGFVGGTRQNMLNLSRSIASIIDTDVANGIVPTWHDESALNKVLARKPPKLTLNPSMCHPQDSSWYETFWTESYTRKLVALDKDSKTRGDR